MFDTYRSIQKVRASRRHLGIFKPGHPLYRKGLQGKLRQLEARLSMSRRTCCWGSACIESFWGQMEKQMRYTAHLLASEVMERVDNYVSYYNNLTGQERLGWLTPLRETMINAP
ncbi:MAG: hypothetical protein DUD39_09750 [Coriobacteriaceae bacterium]|nr:MAG: hypothetical protein DUD39_09750 [Coriobacteriaceae bacterium]